MYLSIFSLNYSFHISPDRSLLSGFLSQFGLIFVAISASLLFLKQLQPRTGLQRFVVLLYWFAY